MPPDKTRNPTLIHADSPVPAFQPDLRFGSNAVRLSGREWVCVGVVCLVGFLFASRLWERVERFEPDADYRIPHELSQDYGHFRRTSRLAASQGKVLVLGDSVIWGEYVMKGQTLSHCLNEHAAKRGQESFPRQHGGTDASGHAAEKTPVPFLPRFANLGVDGLHPVALAGLLEYYGGHIAGRQVLLHCNLLWTASEKHDLQTKRGFAFNHPDLVPQFLPRIPCYTEPYTRRVGIAIERGLPFFDWANHLRQAYFEQKDLPAWTLDHPRANPLAAIRLEVPEPEDRPRHEPVSWTERAIRKEAFAWVGLETSLQWRFFRRAVATLQRRGNRVFVLVGPFNEHLLTDASRRVYAERRSEVEAWLRAEGIPHLAPPPLPSELCADASHPLAEGYARLAKQLIEDPGFIRFHSR